MYRIIEKNKKPQRAGWRTTIRGIWWLPAWGAVAKQRPLRVGHAPVSVPVRVKPGAFVKKTPVQLVTERFQSKEKLVEAVTKLATAELWLDRTNADKGLARASNAKLLRLHATLEDAKKRFGSRDKLIAALLELEKRVKDAGYKTRLGEFSLPRLIDLHDAAARRSKRAENKPKPAAKPAKAAKKARSKKAKAKAKAKAA